MICVVSHNTYFASRLLNTFFIENTAKEMHLNDHYEVHSCNDSHCRQTDNY